MDRMNDTETIRDLHVGWPAIFPDVPEFLVDALTFFSQAAREAQARAGQDGYVGNRDIAQGQAFAYNSAAEWLAEDLARGMWYGDGNALVWMEWRQAS